MNREHYDRAMQTLVGFRGTLEEIRQKICTLGLRDDVVLEPFEEQLEGCDLGFNTNIGELKINTFKDSTHIIYLDYEVFMLPTLKADVYLVTEVIDF